ncbi:hypothetical protein BX600DRAFT_508905 [Xylariales sp. PMI_506]|nr:hypothetical protein BX600DRAFT_508905 [Xylariales sp. PMI_506]
MASYSTLPQTVSLPSSLDAARILSLPPAAYYVPNFISEEEEQLILDKVSTAPKPRWKQLTHRRLQTWPSDLVNNKLVDASLPDWLEEPIVSRLKSIPLSPAQDTSDLFHDSPHQRPNHVLINEYPPGVGIMPHKLSTECLCLNLYQNKQDGSLEPVPVWRILQEPRSLLITTQDLYTEYLHGIADITEDDDLSENTVANWNLLRASNSFDTGRNVRALRTSLTYRDVMKVTKLGNKFSLFQKK